MKKLIVIFLLIVGLVTFAVVLFTNNIIFLRISTIIFACAAAYLLLTKGK